jgi:hypothetical protein
LETIRDSERILQILTDLKVVRESSIEEKPNTHGLDHTTTAADPNTTHQHLTTKI